VFEKEFKKLKEQAKPLVLKARGLSKSPFLYLGIFAVVLTCSVVFLTNTIEKGEMAEANMFDESQYLFSETGEAIPHIDLNIISSSVLEPVSPPFLVQGKVLASYGFTANKEISEYIVKGGDTLGSIAEKFNISLNTILWANDLSSKSVLKVAQKLVIMPVSGVMHVVREGDTLSQIALIHETKVEDIVDFNELKDEARIFAGDFLIVPNGIKPKASVRYATVPLSNSYFIAPIPSPARVTQGLHWFNAIDFSNGKCNEPVYAAAGGKVQRTGYTKLGGRYVRILHANGVVTYYGHLSKIETTPGAKVYQGQVIGYIGYSGTTIPAGPAGCHVHFDVRFAKNPFQGYGPGDTVK